MQIGTRIQKLLTEQGISQCRLAHDLHLNPNTINGYIKNRRLRTVLHSQGLPVTSAQMSTICSAIRTSVSIPNCPSTKKKHSFSIIIAA